MRASDQDRLTPPDAEPEASARARPVGGLAGTVFSLISLSLAVLMAVTLYFILQSVNELSGLEKRLAELNQFEKRLNAKIDLVNTGVQGQIERLSSTVSALSAELREMQADLKAARRNLEILARSQGGAAAALAAGEEPSGGEVHLTAPPSPAPAGAEGEGGEAQSTAASQPAGSWRFERTVGPDGKVTYSRIR